MNALLQFFGHIGLPLCRKALGRAAHNASAFGVHQHPAAVRHGQQLTRRAENLGHPLVHSALRGLPDGLQAHNLPAPGRCVNLHSLACEQKHGLFITVKSIVHAQRGALVGAHLLNKAQKPACGKFTCEIAFAFQHPEFFGIGLPHFCKIHIAHRSGSFLHLKKQPRPRRAA